MDKTFLRLNRCCYQLGRKESLHTNNSNSEECVNKLRTLCMTVDVNVNSKHSSLYYSKEFWGNLSYKIHIQNGQ